jgi:hypothetical protein
MADTERIGKMNEAFGLLGITAASVMSSAAVDTVKLTKELETIDDTAAKTAAQMDSGLGGSFRRFMSGVEGVAIALAEAIEGPLAAWMEWGAAMSQEIIILVKHNQGMIQTLAYIGGVVLAVGGALIGFAAAAKLVAFGIMAWTLATKAATIAQTMLLALSGPKGWAVLAAGAAIAAGAAYAVKTAYDAESKTLEAAIAKNDEAASKLGDVQNQIKQGAAIPPAKLLADGEPAKLDEADESMRKLIVSLAGLRGATAEVLAQQSAGDALTAIGLLGGDAAQIAAERLRKYVEDAIPPSEQLKRKLLEVDAAIAAMGGNVPDGLGTTLKLDVLEQSTGALSSIRELRDEIALLNGTATEASQDVAALADQGVPPEILDQYRKLREERDKLQEQQKRDEEAAKADESQLDDLRQKAQAVMNDTRTPQEKMEVELEQLQQLKATLDPNTGTPLLDEETYQRALKKLHDEQLELAGRDAERLRSPKVQGNQDVRSAEGSKMLIDLLNGRSDVELKQLQAVLIANRRRANLITLTERQSTLRRASTRNS